MLYSKVVLYSMKYLYSLILISLLSIIGAFVVEKCMRIKYWTHIIFIPIIYKELSYKYIHMYVDTNNDNRR